MSTRDEILMELGISPFWKRNVEGNATPQCEDIGSNNESASVSSSERQSGILFKSSTHTILGGGDLKARWLFIAEEPGNELNSVKGPLVGDVGKLLDNMLEALRLNRDKDVYLLDVRRTFSESEESLVLEEQLACEEFLNQQIDLIQPLLIVTMGSAALKRLKGDNHALDHGHKVYDYRGINFVATFHPLDLLRRSSQKAIAWRDLCFASQVMRADRSGKSDDNSHAK